MISLNNMHVQCPFAYAAWKRTEAEIAAVEPFAPQIDPDTDTFFCWNGATWIFAGRGKWASCNMQYDFKKHDWVFSDIQL